MAFKNNMIYDCFTFFNELDLLEIRLNILNDVVDKFVIVESTKTHSNLNKLLYFNENKQRYKKFNKKIIHIIVDDHPQFINSWTFEKYQRDCIARGLIDCRKDDTIIISDLDEIPNPQQIKRYKNKKGIIAFKQKMFYYYLNNIDLKNPFWANTPSKMLKYSEFKKYNFSPQYIRFAKSKLIRNGGWHFSYLGGSEAISEKIKSFAHQEYNSIEYTDISQIEKKVILGYDIFNRGQGKRYASIKVNNNFPKYLLLNQKKYSKLINRADINLKDKLRLESNKIKRNIIISIKNFIPNTIKSKDKIYK